MPKDRPPESIILSLAPLTWNGLVAPPYDVINYTVKYDLAERRFPYLDGAAHDVVGRQPHKFAFRFYFLNTLEPNLYPELFFDWEIATMGPGVGDAPGELFHPMLGKRDCYPSEWGVEANVTRTSGVVVTATFIETIRDVEQGLAEESLAPQGKAIANAVDNQMEDLGVSYPTGIRSGASFTEMMGQLEGLSQSTQLTVGGYINQAQGVVDSVTDVVDSLPSHEKWPLLTNLKRLGNSLEDLKTASAFGADVNGRATAEFTSPVSETFGTLAGILNNTEDELINLNITLLKRPNIQAGTPVTYFVTDTPVFPREAPVSDEFVGRPNKPEEPEFEFS